jgi:hypothetical protein
MQMLSMINPCAEAPKNSSKAAAMRIVMSKSDLQRE